MKLVNNVEQIVPHLYEVRSALTTKAAFVTSKLREIERLQADVERLRGDLLEDIQVDWVESEIEAADVMATRSA